VNILLFNNQIYGLTKGQYSPTTPMGSITKTSPQGTIEHPFNPGELVLGAQGTFFARAVDNNPKLMVDVMFEAAKHDGTSIIEILENCVIFADKTHAAITAKDLRDDFQVHLKHGEPIIFGTNKEKGIRLNGTVLEVVKIGENGITEKDILVHDQYSHDPGIHLMLAKMAPPHFPVAMGVIRSAMYPTYDDMVEDQITMAKNNTKIRCVDDLLNSGETWEIK
jgi:2-oxoglutarate ferredoxin oxidoreductase subunit beta